MKFDLIGSGGGGSKIKNVPDNLQSVDSYEALIGLGSSRMRLAPGGLQNLYVNDVQVEDRDGNSNFSDFTAVLFDGNPTVLEPVDLVLGQSAGATSVNLTLANDNAGMPGDWVTAAMTTPGVDFIDCRLVIQQLYAQTKKGVKNQSATIEVELRPSGKTNWINPLILNIAPTYDQDGLNDGKAPSKLIYRLRSVWKQKFSPDDPDEWADATPGKLTIQGKTTSQYVRELRIAVPNTGSYRNVTWQVRMRLMEIDYQVTGDDGENEDRRTIVWESIAGVSTKKIGGTEAWRGLSYLQIYGKATDQISGTPTITGVYDIGEYPIPPSTVWNAQTRTYTGFAWDGMTHDIGWSQCPAWQIKALIEDDLSGLSALNPGSTLNKWDALEASKWFATRVPDGYGGMHPRYSANWYIEDPMEAHELVNYLAGAVGAYCWDEGNGQWRMKVEKPETASHIFTKENIVGDFNYAHTDFDSRYNDFIGVFRNRDNLYQEDRCRVWDQENIDNTGRRHTTVVLVGCDNRQEALRRLKIRLLTSLNEYRIVTFTTNRQGLMLEPFSTIAVADGDLIFDPNIRSTGRIVDVANVGRTIRVRDTLRLEPGVEYHVQITVPNPGYNPNSTSQPASTNWREPTTTITRKVMNTSTQRGDVVTLHLDAAIPENTPEYAVVTLTAPGLPTLPKAYRVTNITQDDSNPELVTISATEIYTPKWSESDNVSEDQLHSQVPSRHIDPPTAPAEGMFSVKTFMGERGINRILTVTWVRPNSMFLKDYRVEYQLNGGPWVSWGNTVETSLEMQNPEFGVYTFRIYAVDRRGFESVPLEGTYGFDEAAGDNRPVGSLTAESVVLSASPDGVVTDFSPANGDFRLFDGAKEITEDVVFSVVASETVGTVTATINATTGEYRVTAMGTDQARVTFRAVYAGMTIERSLTLAKARRGMDGVEGPAGLPGDAGVNSAIVYIYQRSQTEPPLPTQITTYSFAANEITGLNNGWLSRIPEGTDPIWVSVASVSSTSLTDYIGANEWTDPVILTKNGVNTATIYLFQRTDTAVPPALPSQNATYTFATKSITGVNNGWSTSLPLTGGRYRWLTMGTALSDGPQDIIPPDDWTAASLLAVDGADGADGSDGADGNAAEQPVTIDMSLSSVALWAYANGVVLDYSPANGFFKVRRGNTDITSQALFSHSATPGVSAWVDANGNYGVTNMTTDTGSVTFNITVDGTVYSRVLSISKTKAGYEIVSFLPIDNLFVGRMVFLTTDNKLYRYTPTGWTASVQIDELPADMVEDILSQLNLANIAGKITHTQISDEAIRTPHLAAGSVATEKLAAGAVTAEKMVLASRKAIAQGFNFRVIGTTLHWDSGRVFWMNDAGNPQQTVVSAGSVVWQGSFVHVMWAKGATTLHVSHGGWSEAMDDDTLELAIWQGGTSLIVYYGSTTIDGDQIMTGSIKARNIAAEAIETDHLSAGIVTAAKLASTELITVKAQIKEGLIDSAHIQDLSVKNAHIENLTIGTGKIQDGAITRAAVFFHDYSGVHSNLPASFWRNLAPSGYPVMEVSIQTPDQILSGNPFVLIDVTLVLARDGGDDDNISFRVMRSDNVALPQELTNLQIMSSNRPYHLSFVDSDPPLGTTVTYRIQGYNIPNDGSPYLHDCVLRAIVHQK